MVGAEPDLTALLQLGCKHVDRSRMHHAPLGMTRLGPGVGMEYIDKAERPVGHTGQDVQGITHVQADVRQESIADMLQRADHAVQKRLAADKAMIRKQVGTISEMLAGPEAEFEVKGAIIAEIGRAEGGDRGCQYG